MEYLEIGSAPYDEECVPVNPKVDYLPAMREECKRYMDLLVITFGEPPEGSYLKIKSFPHDFGSYLEVVVYYHEDNEEECDYALMLEGNPPATWEV